MKHHWFLFLQFSLTAENHHGLILLFQRLLWTSTSDTSIIKRYLTLFVFWFFNILIRGNPIKMCCFEVLKINRCSGVTQIVRSLWKRRGENCFCITSMAFLWHFSFWIATQCTFFLLPGTKIVHSLSRWVCNFGKLFWQTKWLIFPLLGCQNRWWLGGDRVHSSRGYETGKTDVQTGK